MGMILFTLLLVAVLAFAIQGDFAMGMILFTLLLVAVLAFAIQGLRVTDMGPNHVCAGGFRPPATNRNKKRTQDR